VNLIGTKYIDRLLDEHGAALVLYARQWAKSPDDALQETLIELIRLPQTPDDPVAWTYAALRRRSIDQARSESRRAGREKRRASEQDNWFEANVESGLDADHAVEMIQRLEPELRETLVARIWGNLSFDDIAKATQTSTSTAHRRYHQALAEMRTIIDPQPKSKPSQGGHQS
jgi:RNA polymerase sigma factor (sigma-70 family)